MRNETVLRSFYSDILDYINTVRANIEIEVERSQGKLCFTLYLEMDLSGLQGLSFLAIGVRQC
jgi:hypothetical protein